MSSFSKIISVSHLFAASPINRIESSRRRACPQPLGELSAGSVEGLWAQRKNNVIAERRVLREP